MDANIAKNILDKVVGTVFGYQNPLTLEQAMQKFAFDLKLPQQVYDSMTGEATWAISTNPSKFITVDNSRSYGESHSDWMISKRELGSIEDILTAWAETNYTSTERILNSINVLESDSIYDSENVYRSSDLRNAKNVLFSYGGSRLEYVVAATRSTTSSYSIRVEDSQLCSNSFNVIWSAKVSNSMFIQDCYDVMDCMFCSHISGKRFCVANMQFSEDEYLKIKDLVVKWVLSS